MSTAERGKRLYFIRVYMTYDIFDLIYFRSMFGSSAVFSSVAQKLGDVSEQKTLFPAVVQQLFETKSYRVRQSLSALPVIENPFKV